MPLHTILIVGGSWVILLILTIWHYRRTRDEAAERPASYKPDASGAAERPASYKPDASGNGE